MSTAEPPRARKSRRGSVVWAGAALLVAVAAALMPHLDVAAGGIVPVVQALVPVGAVLLLLLAVVPLVRRRWAAAVILVVGAVLAGIPALTPARGSAACDARAPLTVVSFNAKFARADAADVAALVRAARADVVVLVETDEALIEAVREEHDLADLLPYRTREVSAGGVGGSVILSAHPLRDEEEIPGSVFDQVSAVATLPDGSDVRVAAVHPPPPVGQPLDWHDALTDLDAWIAETTDAHLVVAGDFNASFAHPVFRELAAPLRSAAEAAGPIPWPTWPEEKPPVPAFTAIDHVLARGAEPAGWDSAAVTGSDHRAVVGQWRLCAP